MAEFTDPAPQVTHLDRIAGLSSDCTAVCRLCLSMVLLPTLMLECSHKRKPGRGCLLVHERRAVDARRITREVTRRRAFSR